MRYKAVEVVKIGTRALISKEGKPMLATHWDGYPSLLGMDLLHCDKTMEAVIKIAKRHTIDAAHRSIHEDLNRERIKELAEDHEICNIDNYGDWAEYQYDIRGKEIYFRPLKKWYPVSLENAPEFKLLKKKEVEKY